MHEESRRVYLTELAEQVKEHINSAGEWDFSEILFVLALVAEKNFGIVMQRDSAGILSQIDTSPAFDLKHPDEI